MIRSSLLGGLALVAWFMPALASSSEPASTSQQFSPGHEYDARAFLSHTQQTQFEKQYPEFDRAKAEKNWEWKDVDPLGLLAAAENRSRRRDRFLMEYSSTALPESDGPPSPDQLAFQAILKTQFEGPTILMSGTTLKISTPYTESYEHDLPVKNLFERLAQVGLQWAQLGGTNAYIYNGAILLARYRAGWVSLADTNIDRPATAMKSRQGK